MPLLLPESLTPLYGFSTSPSPFNVSEAPLTPLIDNGRCSTVLTAYVLDLRIILMIRDNYLFFTIFSREFRPSVEAKFPVGLNTKHLYNIFTLGLSDVIQMLYKCFVFRPTGNVL